MNKKYKLLKNDTITVGRRTLYRIQALRDFSDVKKGNLGGYIEKESNLSHENHCWVYDDAKVFDDAWVCDDTKVFDNAKIYGDAVIYGNARVFDRSHVYGNAQVYGNAYVYGDSKIHGVTWITGNSTVKNTELSDGKNYYNYQWYYDTPLYKAMYG